MKRKTIGVFLSGDDSQLQGEFLVGIKQGAVKENCNIVNFHSLINKAVFNSEVVPASSVIRGESSPYTGFDYSQLDAVIIMGDTFIASEIKNQIVSDALSAGIPVIDVDDEDERCHCVRYDDAIGMELMIRHVVEEHGCRSVNFISGFKGNRQSEERIKAYRKVLAENNIPVEEERIGYGEFYIKSVEVMKTMLESTGLPEAVICANDTMAVMVISYLTSLGYEIPKDCIVTGFDGTIDGQAYIPALTSVKRAIKESGEKAVELAIRLSEGEEVEKVTWLEPVMIKGQSCGCEEIAEHPIDKIYQLMEERVNRRNLFNAELIQMTREFSHCSDVWGILDKAFNHAWFYNVPSMSFFIDDKVSGTGKEEKSANGDGKLPYSEKLGMVKWLSTGEKKAMLKVSAKSFVKNHMSAANAPVFMGVIPMYYDERIIGFLSIDQTCCVSELQLLSTWMVSICSTIGSLCLKNELEYLIYKLNDMSVKDSLTGLYNRFGLNREAKRMLERAINENSKVFAIGIDLDELKKINDKHGHQSGDNAILQVANAMRYAARADEILSRIGGDEYFVLGICNDDEKPDEYVNKLEEYLSNYNAEKNVAYSVNCSCGKYIANPESEDVERIMRQADILMYEAKSIKKQGSSK